MSGKTPADLIPLTIHHVARASFNFIRADSCVPSSLETDKARALSSSRGSRWARKEEVEEEGERVALTYL